MEILLPADTVTVALVFVTVAVGAVPALRVSASDVSAKSTLVVTTTLLVAGTPVLPVDI